MNKELEELYEFVKQLAVEPEDLSNDEQNMGRRLALSSVLEKISELQKRAKEHE